MIKPSLIAAALLVVLSCSEQNESPTIDQARPSEQFKSFSSKAELEDFTNKIPLMTDQDLDDWEKENSFISFRTVWLEAVKEWDALEAQEDQLTFLNKYSDILSIQDNGITPKIDIRVYQSIVSREGIYEVNGMLNKVVGNFVVSAKTNEYSRLKNIAFVDESNHKALAQRNGVIITRITGEDFDVIGRSKAACSTEMTASYFDNHSNCRNDREVFISAKSYIVPISIAGGRKYQLRVQFKVWGTLRTGTWCKWKSYSTTLQYRNISFSIMGHIASPGGEPVPQRFDINLADYAPEGDRSDLVWDQPIGEAVLAPISPPAFISLHAEGSSRGVAGNWAVLDCQ